MSFVGGSTLQATQIGAVDGRATALENRAITIEQTAQTLKKDFNEHVANQNTRNITQEGRLTTLEQASNSTNSIYNAYATENNTKNIEQDAHLSELETDVASNYSTFQTAVSNLNATDIIINTHLCQIDTSIATTTTDAATFRQTYNTYVTNNNLKNNTQDKRLTAVENDVSAFHDTYIVDKANTATDFSEFHSAYNVYIQTNDTKNTIQDKSLTSIETKIENSKQAFEEYVASNTAGNNTARSIIETNKSKYDAYVSANNTKNSQQVGRLDTHESRLDSIDTNIIGRVDDAINSKVATTTFDRLAKDLRDVDSDLSITLATKVASTVQVQTDAVQDAKIDTRVLQIDYDTYVSNGTNTKKLSEIKIAAMEQFIRTFLSTYTIKNGVDQKYTYKGYAQKDFEVALPTLSFVSRFNDDTKINIKALEYATRSNANQIRIISAGQVTLLSASVGTESETVSASLGDITKVYTMTRAVTSIDFPIKLRYQDTNDNVICEQALTYIEYRALPNNDVRLIKSTGVTYNSATSKVSIVYATAQEAASITNVTYNIDDSDGWGPTLLTAVTTTVSNTIEFSVTERPVQVRIITKVGVDVQEDVVSQIIREFVTSELVNPSTITYSDGQIILSYPSTDIAQGIVELSYDYWNGSSWSGVVNVKTQNIIINGTTAKFVFSDSSIISMRTLVKFGYTYNQKDSMSATTIIRPFVQSITRVGDMLTATYITPNGGALFPAITTDRGINWIPIGSQYFICTPDTPITITFNISAYPSATKTVLFDIDGGGVMSVPIDIPAAVPSAPTNLVATAGVNQVSISYTPGSNRGDTITNYKYSVDNGVTWFAFSPAVIGSPVTITGLVNGTTYLVKLRAVNSVGDGAISSSISVTPAAAPINSSLADNIGWAINCGGGTSNDTGNAITVDSERNIYVTGLFGVTFNVLNIDGSIFKTLNATGGNDAFVIKYSPSGTPLWATSFGGTGIDRGNAITVDSLNNVYVTGQYVASCIIKNMDGTTFKTLTAVSSGDVFVIKYSPSGTPLWATSCGGASSDSGNSIAVDSTNNIYITGVFSATFNVLNMDGSAFKTLTSASGSPDAFVIKYSPNGTPLWATICGGTSNDAGNSITVDSLNNIYITGQYTNSFNVLNMNGSTFKTLTPLGSDDAFVIKYSPSGTPLWATSFGGTGIDRGNAITVDSLNNVYVTGQYVASCIIKNMDGTTFKTLTSVGGSDVFVIKYNTDGTPLWATSCGGAGSDIARSIAVDSKNNVYITGQSPSLFVKNMDGSEFKTLTAFGSVDLFIIKYNTDGTPLWATSCGSDGNDIGYSIAVDSLNNVYVTGSYSSSFNILNMDGSTFKTMTSVGNSDVFVIKYNTDGKFV